MGYRPKEKVYYKVYKDSVYICKVTIEQIFVAFYT